MSERTFGDNLKYLRKKRSLTRSQLAAGLGIKYSTLGHYEHGDRHPNFSTLKKIARYFDVSVDYLIGNMAHEQVKCKIHL